MDSAKKSSWFAGLLSRLLGRGSLREEDRSVIRAFPVRHRNRRELPLPQANQMVQTVDDFVRAGDIDARGVTHPMPKYKNGREGMRELGWDDWPYSTKILGEGFYGTVHLGYWLGDVNEHLEKRRFCALKVQALEERNADIVWMEVAILRSMKHENIIDYYGSFIVAPETGNIYQKEKATGMHSASPKKGSHDKHLEPAQPDNWSRPLVHTVANKPPGDEVWILLEFADAADLHTEILRYENRCIPEIGARFYMKQICSGLKYLHDRGIIHNDLHYYNVLLKYGKDGRTKGCLICDFGVAEFMSKGKSFAGDVKDAVEIMCCMLTGVPNHPPAHEPVFSQDARNLMTTFCSEPHPDTVKKLLKHVWFKGPAVAPEPELGQAAGGTVPLMDYVNPDPPPRKLDAKSRWPTAGRARRPASATAGRGRRPPSASSMPPIREESPSPSKSRSRSAGSGRLAQFLSSPGPSAGAAAQSSEPTSSEESFGGFFHQKVNEKGSRKQKP